MRRAAGLAALALACVAEFPPPDAVDPVGTGSSASESSTTAPDDSGSTSTSAATSDASSDADATGPRECGNGIVEAGELCDQAEKNGIGACKDDCTLNYCGDHYVGPGELCDDGNDDDDVCTPDCTLPNCGNMNTEPPEECDDGNGNDDDDCLSTCVEATCGDQHVHARVEICDADAVGTATCESVGSFDGGTLACNPECDGFDTSGCYACGDGAIDPGEECDIVSLGGASCRDVGMEGEVSCTAECVVDYSQCSICGDNVMNGSEACDGTDLGGQTCINQGFDGGMLLCNAQCQLNTSACCVDTGEPCAGDNDCCSGDCNAFSDVCNPA